MDFYYSVVTEKTVDEAVRALEESLQAHQFGVLWKLDLSSKLQEKGVDFRIPYRILEVCNPHEAKKVLTQNLLVGYFLPCKIVVYEQNGKTHIGLPKPSQLMDIIGDSTLSSIAQDVETSLVQAIDAAK
ncbi:DUF302 domain-containing protein [Alicyclobacillus tolerans]|uniref:Uncharacterized protein (DUF302 family) n=2 Tax=Alicyclobacillus tolerans TaxID=90970 RepID=A0ABT9LS74_9BACL|nr:MULTISPECIES: DUF302 domain-containing protein [Alicyclobacillus]MDP9727112.1 uncharacterized protein (DUF302 family) [Alicyclobacillus tengchongensis]QRF22884.1 DUF302 domain-containing protein [Alicyclobacillus sp. TC]SHL16601.1 Uncharacterized conserved protein, DUF302 family [Alicyclobacillus montanus]